MAQAGRRFRVLDRAPAFAGNIQFPLPVTFSHNFSGCRHSPATSAAYRSPMTPAGHCEREIMIKTAILGLSACALLFGLGVGPWGGVPGPQPAPVLEGKDRPILLQRMVVTATPLSD